MEIINWTQTIQRNSHVGIISGVKEQEQSGKSSTSTSNTDSLEISEAGRQAAMAAEMEKGGLSHDAAVKLASGQIKINEPDWDTFEVPTLKVSADPKIYNTTYLENYLKNLDDIRSRVEAYYTPEYSKIKSMDDNKVMDYLYKTYLLPYQDDLYVPGTKLPSPPEGMSKDEAAMFYKQLKGMRFGGGVTLYDPYALGEDGIQDLKSAEERVRQTAQEAYDAAQKEVDAKQEVWKAQRKEDFKRVIANINSGSGVCMGYMALRPDGSGENVE